MVLEPPGRVDLLPAVGEVRVLAVLLRPAAGEVLDDARHALPPERSLHPAGVTCPHTSSRPAGRGREDRPVDQNELRIRERGSPRWRAGGVVGEATEVELSTTPVKTAVFTEAVPGWEECFPGTATQVHQQAASAIVDLAPGEYVTTGEDVCAGGEPYTSTVRLTVLPD